MQGALTRSVSDSAWYVDLIGAPGAEHLTPSVGRDPGRLVVGVSTTPMRVGLPGKVDAEAVAAVHDTASILEGLGHDVRQVDLPLDRAAQEFSLRYLRAIHDAADIVEDPHRLERRTRQLVTLGASLEGNAKTQLERISDAATHCQSVVKSLVSFGRKHKPEMASIDINALCAITAPRAFCFLTSSAATAS